MTVLAAATLFAVALVFIFLSQKPEPLPDLKGLSLTQSEYLKNISQVRLREGVKIGLVGLAKDHRIFMASNREGPAAVTLSLTSIPKRGDGEGNDFVYKRSETRRTFLSFLINSSFFLELNLSLVIIKFSSKESLFTLKES